MQADPHRIRTMQPADWESVRAIYAEGIATGNATFEAAAPDWPHWDAAHRTDCRLVAVDAQGLTGFGALSPVSTRAVYVGVAEVSVYIAARARGAGQGTTLLAALIRGSEAAGIWTLQAGIFPENSASLRLHERAGFRIVGTRHRIARRDGRWRDVVLLERRSSTIGV